MATTPAHDAPRPYLLQTGVASDGLGRSLTVVICKEFDFGNLHQDWAVSVANQAPGPFTEVVLDLSQCGLVSSTFFAGLLQLRATYCAKGAAPLVLRHPDPRVVRNLTVMRLQSLFRIEPRPKPGGG